MIKRLGNFFILAGLICLAIFFTSSAFMFEDAWFLLGGIGFTSFGLLLRRASYPRRERQKRKNRRRRGEKDVEDE